MLNIICLSMHQPVDKHGICCRLDTLGRDESIGRVPWGVRNYSSQNNICSLCRRGIEAHLGF